MMHAFRLKRGDDLLCALRAYAEEKDLQAAVVLSSVGCVSAWRMRGADGKTLYAKTERAEIISLQGTVSALGCHLHISLSREDLSVFGGHLVEGCIINTTAEMVLCEVPHTRFARVWDAQTGYRELQIDTEGRA